MADIKKAVLDEELARAEKEWIPTLAAAKTWSDAEVTRKAWMYVGAKELAKRLELRVLEEKNK